MQSRRTRARHPRLRCHFKDTGPKVRRLFRIAGFGDQYEFGVHNNSAVNLERGLMERVYFVKNAHNELVPCPEPEGGIFNKRLWKYGKCIADFVGRRHPVSYEKFLSYYTGPKLTLYQKAVDSLQDLSVNERDARLKTFVKAEKLNVTLKADPVPRVIQPRTPRYNVELGRYLRPVEHDIYRAIDDLWGGPTIMKGYSVEKMGAHIQSAFRAFNNPVAIGFDASRFDQHVSVEALRYEHKIYNRIYSYPWLLGQLLKWQVHNKGTAFASDGVFNYTVDGKRMSGDMNTSLGNCILACLITKDLVDTLGIEARLINNGDDNVLICNVVDRGEVEKTLYSHWLRYGFEVVCEPPVYVLEQLNFCQMNPVFDGVQYVMVRNPTTTMSKDAYSITPFNSAKAAQMWARAVGECGLSITGGIPIVQEYYHNWVRNGRDSGKIKHSKDFDSGLYHLSKLSSRKYSEVCEDARYSFYLAFGYTPDEQVEMENYYRHHTPLWEWSNTGNLAKSPECLLLQILPTPPSLTTTTTEPPHRVTARPSATTLPTLLGPN